MAMDQNVENEGSPKDRIGRLFQFLLEANRLRYAPERTLKSQVLVIPLTDLPQHPSIQLLRPIDSEAQGVTPFEFRVSSELKHN
jgi:hypothetical protein